MTKCFEQYTKQTKNSHHELLMRMCVVAPEAAHAAVLDKAAFEALVQDMDYEKASFEFADSSEKASFESADAGVAAGDAGIGVASALAPAQK